LPVATIESTLASLRARGRSDHEQLVLLAALAMTGGIFRLT
jgi:hypothetical protein